MSLNRVEEIKKNLDIQGFEIRHTETGWAWEVTKNDGTTLNGEYIGAEYWQDVFEREVLMRILMDNATPRGFSIGFDSTVLGGTVKSFAEAEKLESAYQKLIPRTEGDGFETAPDKIRLLVDGVPQLEKELDPEPEVMYFNDEVDKIHAESLALMLKKRRDYGTRNLTFHGEFGILVRIMDKIMRLTNIHQSGEAAVKDESIRDSWIDVINYGVLGLLAHENKLELPDRPMQNMMDHILKETIDEVLAEELREISDRPKDVVSHADEIYVGMDRFHQQELQKISAQASSIGTNFLVQSDVASKVSLSGAGAWHAYDEPPKRKSKVYLAGSVEGIAPEVARGWRNEFKNKGWRYFNIFDPVHETNHLFEAGKTKEAWDVNWQAIQECDIFFCNLIPGAKSYGSLRELQKAVDLGKDIWLVRPKNTASDNSLPDIKNKFEDWVQAYIDMGTKYRGS